jgi:ATP-binding cassette, subfamily F, member 3
MSVLIAHGLGQSFGDFDVFTGVSCRIPNDGKIGLVGPNGIGKTTLLLALAGIERPSAGQVHLARGARVGYLPQEAMTAFTEQDHTVYDEMLAVFAPLRAKEAELRALEEAMAGGGVGEPELARYGEAQSAFELAGGYAYETRIQQVLSGLGFSAAHHGLPLAHLSGGQKTRVLLARLLLEAPELLVLDEPTNHLDGAAVEWLEGTLAAWDGAVLVVSHDRYFLDRVVDHVWELTRTGLVDYRGNYSAYVIQRSERRDLEGDLFASETERLRKELDYVRRNIAGQNTDIARGRLKRLSRDIVALEERGVLGTHGRRWSELGIGRVSAMAVDEAGARLAALRGPAGPAPTLDLRLAASRRGGDVVLRAASLAVGYPGAPPLLTVGDVEVQRGERLAVIGPNGSGKTTLLRTLMGELAPLSGTVRPGGGIQPGYFAQAHDTLPIAGTVLGAFLGARDVAPGVARGYLARYLFQGDDVDKPLAVLSGGERARLALALLALEGANLLLLDEPTNHLDIPAQEVLQDVLGAFEGTILVVSHDRYLVDRLATGIWSIEAATLVTYEGNYEAYLAQRDAARDDRRARQQARAADRHAERAGERAAERARRRHAEAVAALEGHITALERSLGDLEARLQRAGEAGDFVAVGQLDAQHRAAREDLERTWAQWAELAENGPPGA